MQGNRQEIFDYVFLKADEVGYMALDSSLSSKFQDALQEDKKLIELAGEKLSRNYIKDTILNNYSKKQRYINKEDVLNIFHELDESNIIGSKKDLENGLFEIHYQGNKIICTSSSFSEWQTVFKRFGEKDKGNTKFAFLTCGGVKKSFEEIKDTKDIIESYGINTFIVKPNEKPLSIQKYISTSNERLVLSIELSKPFLLLAGISGTGKTRFVREQAKATGSLNDTYCLTSVRPDWHEPSDILGYISRLGRDDNAEYITTDVLQFIAKAWCAIIDAGLELEPKGNGLAVIGDKSELEQVLPYWLCLDEMNLAPVEQYFADYLSILETREWQWEDEQFTYCCDSLLKSETIKQLDDKSKLRKALGFTGEQYDDAWDLFCDHGLGLPFNLIVAGTVNMDETTHGFSRKVIDRALSFDFGDFFPNEFDHFFKPKVIHNALSYPIYSQASINKLPPIDSDGSKSISFLKSINKVLNDTPFQLAFRALNELLLAVISAYPEDEKQLQAVWDDFLMCKVLPRIEGDHDKLAIIDDSVNSHEESLLTELTAILKQELVDIWSMEGDQEKLRPDLYRKNIDGSILYIACRSKAKLTWMQQRLERYGFTSFWP